MSHEPKLEGDTVIMNKEHYMGMYRSVALLNILEAHGVDNWEGYHLAMKEYTDKFVKGTFS